MASKLYLKQFRLPSFGQEDDFIQSQHRTCYNGIYPFKLFPARQLRTLDFAAVTIFYGSNGSGKTTLLNIIAEKLRLIRHSPFNGSAFFPEYISMCAANTSAIPRDSRILTSDDVSDYLLNLRCLNAGIAARRNELFDEYTARKYKDLRFSSLADYDDWKVGYDAKTKSQSQFVKDRLMRNVDMHSNGETAMLYYSDRIAEDD